jgi:hypothetical protein
MMMGTGAATNRAFSGVTGASPDMLVNRAIPPSIGTRLNSTSRTATVQSLFVSFLVVMVKAPQAQARDRTPSSNRWQGS